MGIPGFYPWLKKIGYVPKQIRVNRQTDRLLVDAKLFMYNLLYGIAADAQNVPELIAQKLTYMFQGYQVTFCNDGNETISPLKQPTLEERKARRATANQNATILEQEIKEEEIKKEDKPEIDSNSVKDNSLKRPREEELQTPPTKKIKWEKLKRAAREITTQQSKEILSILEKNGFCCIQCSGEADEELVRLASQYTYVLSEDSDLLVRQGGIKNLLRGFQKFNLCYNASDILAQAKLNATQLQWMACVNGFDYFEGIKNIGMKRAYDFAKGCESEDMLLRRLRQSKYSIPPDFQDTLRGVMSVIA